MNFEKTYESRLIVTDWVNVNDLPKELKAPSWIMSEGAEELKRAREQRAAKERERAAKKRGEEMTKQYGPIAEAKAGKIIHEFISYAQERGKGAYKDKNSGKKVVGWLLGVPAYRYLLTLNGDLFTFQNECIGRYSCGWDPSTTKGPLLPSWSGEHCEACGPGNPRVVAVDSRNPHGQLLTFQLAKFAVEKKLVE